MYIVEGAVPGVCIYGTRSHGNMIANRIMQIYE